MFERLRSQIQGIYDAAERGAVRAAREIEALEVNKAYTKKGKTIETRVVPVLAEVNGTDVIVKSSEWVANQDAAKWALLYNRSIREELKK